MTRLLLIRHGETDYNLNRRYCGFSNPPLNAFGISQAETLAKQLKDFDVAGVYSSDLLRATQTAEILFPKHQIKTMPGLREYNFGIFENLTYEEIIKAHPKLYRAWINSPSSVLLPGGEGFEEFKKRVYSALSVIISLNRNKTIAVVTHSGPIRLILCKALDRGLEKFWEVGPGNATFSLIEYSDNCRPIKVKIDKSLHSKAEGTRV